MGNINLVSVLCHLAAATLQSVLFIVSTAEKNLQCLQFSALLLMRKCYQAVIRLTSCSVLADTVYKLFKGCQLVQSHSSHC